MSLTPLQAPAGQAQSSPEDTAFIFHEDVWTHQMPLFMVTDLLIYLNRRHQRLSQPALGDDLVPGEWEMRRPSTTLEPPRTSYR